MGRRNNLIRPQIEFSQNSGHKALGLNFFFHNFEALVMKSSVIIREHKAGVQLGHFWATRVGPDLT